MNGAEIKREQGKRAGDKGQANPKTDHRDLCFQYATDAFARQLLYYRRNPS